MQLHLSKGAAVLMDFSKGAAVLMDFSNGAAVLVDFLLYSLCWHASCSKLKGIVTPKPDRATLNRPGLVDRRPSKLKPAAQYNSAKTGNSKISCFDRLNELCKSITLQRTV